MEAVEAAPSVVAGRRDHCVEKEQAVAHQGQAASYAGIQDIQGMWLYAHDLRECFRVIARVCVQVVLEDTLTNPLLALEFGMSVTCMRDGIPTSFRCILGQTEWNAFHEAVVATVPNVTIDNSLLNLSTATSPQGNNNTNNTNTNITQSTMRSAITSAMDRYDKSTNKVNIKNRRGAMKWLPVHRANDLVLGSWYVMVLHSCLLAGVCVKCVIWV
jgi:hypothetical protein